MIEETIPLTRETETIAFEAYASSGLVYLGQGNPSQWVTLHGAQIDTMIRLLQQAKKENDAHERTT